MEGIQRASASMEGEVPPQSGAPYQNNSYAHETAYTYNAAMAYNGRRVTPSPAERPPMMGFVRPPPTTHPSMGVFQHMYGYPHPHNSNPYPQNHPHPYNMYPPNPYMCNTYQPVINNSMHLNSSRGETFVQPSPTPPNYFRAAPHPPPAGNYQVSNVSTISNNQRTTASVNNWTSTSKKGTSTSTSTSQLPLPSINMDTTVTDTASSSTASTKNVSDENENNGRRSGRAKKSTIVHINGHAVLKQNNYVLKGGSYEHSFHPADAPKPVKRKSSTTAKKDQPKKMPRTISVAENRRSEFNQTIQKRVQDKAPQRSHFLARNVDILKPFLDSKVQEKLLTVPLDAITPLCDEELFTQPDAIQADMRDYQLQGLSFMANMHRKNLGMILGDEMGLGKTLQTISLLCHIKEKHGITGPSLVVCPLSVLYSWCSEIKKWAPSLKFLRFHSSCEKERESQRTTLMEKAATFDVIVTTYEMVKQPTLSRSLWSRQYFNYLVLDEGHRIKDVDSQVSKAVRGVHRENSLILTGTPLQNNLVELRSLLYFLCPDVFTTTEPFAAAFDLTENVVDKEKLNQAHKVLELFMLRRLKDQVERLMPKKLETKVLCPLSNTQIFWYKALLMKDINLLARSSGEKDEGETGQTDSKKNTLNNLVMQLRKCCIHPYLFDGAEVDIDSTTCEDLIAASGKLAVLDQLLRSLYTKKHRVVLFSQFTSVLDIIEDYCKLRGWNSCRFDGSTARAKRNYIVSQFNAPESECFIFLMSTRSGGMGLNLQTADTCILMDSDWNPQPDLQAMARVHRIGQTKTVHVYRLICAGTIEERMVERQDKKLFLDRMVTQDSESPASEEVKLEKNELISTLRFGCDAVFGDGKQNSLPTAGDIEKITDRLRTGDYVDDKIKKVANEVSNFDAEKNYTSTTKLGGIDFKKIRNEHQKKKKLGITPFAAKDMGGIADQWIQLQKSKRKRKSRIIMIDSNGSGWGSSAVPVLAANNYDLENGESSVFQRELGGRKGNFGEIKKKVLRSGIDFEGQDMCQVCGDGGLLMCCPRCPVCVHAKCAGLENEKEFLHCSHHACTKCHKNSQAAGGILFRCQACPEAFCEDCLPPKDSGMRLLGRCERFEKLGFDSTKNSAYIHCSKLCEENAKNVLDWLPPHARSVPCPAELELSYAFGSTIDETVEALKDKEESTARLRRKRKVMNYAELGGSSPVADQTVDKPYAPTPEKQVENQAIKLNFKPDSTRNVHDGGATSAATTGMCGSVGNVVKTLSVREQEKKDVFKWTVGNPHPAPIVISAPSFPSTSATNSGVAANWSRGAFFIGKPNLIDCLKMANNYAYLSDVDKHTVWNIALFEDHLSGRVGVRCIHCKTSSFSGSVDLFSKRIASFAHEHLQFKCQMIPPQKRAEMKLAASDGKKSGFGIPSYTKQIFPKMGIVDTIYGVRFLPGNALSKNNIGVQEKPSIIDLSHPTPSKHNIGVQEKPSIIDLSHSTP